MIPEVEFLETALAWLLAAYPIVFAAIGWTLAKTFATKTNNDKTIDDYIKDRTSKLNILSGDIQYLINKLLHFIHHWWIGAIMVYIFNTTSIAQLPSYPNEVLCWICVGIFVEDGFYHIRGFLGWIQQELPKPII